MCTVNKDDDDDDDGDDSIDSSQDSQDSGRIQIGHQMTNVVPYSGESFLSNKTGELVAALHNQLVCRTLRRCVAGKAFRPPSAHGCIYIGQLESLTLQ